MRAAHHPTGSQVHFLRDQPDTAALCGVRVHHNRAGHPVQVNPAATLPSTLRWCARCVGLLAEQAGRIPALVKELTDA